MTASNQLTAWQRWLRHPQQVPFRRVLFQVHLWCGIGLGLYIFFISLTGSVLVYRNELYAAAEPDPVYSTAPGPLLSDEALTGRALQAYPGYRVARFHRPSNPDQAVVVWLQNDDRTRKRLFDPRSGDDVGSSAATGVLLVTTLMELHESFLAGPAGRTLNGFAAFGVLLMALTGIVLWWPGIARWRRSLMVRSSVGWKRFVWDTHSMVGIWSCAFIVIFALSGAYLCFADAFHMLADLIQPMTDENAGNRLVDKVLYWLAFLHFGRINGIGIPCSGPGVCDQSVKAVWALFGLAPAAMIVTGVTMWWNRELRRWRRKKNR